MTKILIADDHSIVRKGLLYQCKTVFGYQSVDEVSNGNQLMVALKQNKYTHLILDLVMSDGSSLDIVGTIRALYPELNILIFTAKPREMYGPVLEKYGVGDYIEKDAPEDWMIKRLRSFLGSTARPSTNAESEYRTPFAVLTAREVEVLHYWLEGRTNRQISRQLNIADSTVSTHKTRIYRKTGTKTVRELEELATVHKFNG